MAEQIVGQIETAEQIVEQTERAEKVAEQSRMGWADPIGSY